MMRSLFFGLVLFAVGACAQEDAPKVRIVLDKKAVKPGATIEGKVAITFAAGLHGYQNPPSKDYMIPVKLEAEGKEIKLKVTYPTGVPMAVGGETEPALVYEGEVFFPIQITLPKKTGPVKIALKFSYQQCNDSACFPPSSISLVEKITIPAPKKPVKPKKGKGG